MASDRHIGRLHLGAAYYPEHWPPERWPEDIRLMREAGFSVVRMAEFAWSTMEPEEGVFDFDWLESAIAQLADAGIVTALGTPTAAPPAWLVQQHPGLMAVDSNGNRVQFGNRCHYCVTSPDFHDAAKRIARAMGERFGQHAAVIGWQLDNEYNRVCHCDRCAQRFREFLQDRFGSLDVLNEAWSTRYWSQTYSDWDQVPIPIGPHNPGLMLEWKHFVTGSFRRFQRLIIDELRPKLREDMWITHNFMGWFDAFDHYVLNTDLDMASWDWYIGTGHQDFRRSGATHDLTRGFKRRNYWVMETQVGHTNHMPVNNDLARGEMRKMAWHAVAHGADAVLYWQWRMAYGGQEQYWGTIVDQAGRPRPYYEEVREIGQDFATVGDLLASTAPAAEVAILNSYDDRWAINIHRHHKDFDYVEHLLSYYRPLAERNFGIDIVSADAPLDGYRLVIAPALHLLNDERAARLRTFVEDGGHLVLTVRSGVKDDRNALLPSRPPGPLAEMAGVSVEEYFALVEPVPVKGELFGGTSSIWAERLQIKDEMETEVIARFGPSNGWLDDRPAVTSHISGKGRVYVIGAWLDDDSQRALMDHITGAAGVSPVLQAPAAVEARKRVGDDGKEVVILINHATTQQSVTLPWPAHEHLSGAGPVDTVTLEPFGVCVITRALT